MQITPELISNSFIGILVTYVILFIFNVYVLYLNWKQSKVNDQMAEMLKEVKAIRKAMPKKK